MSIDTKEKLRQRRMEEVRRTEAEMADIWVRLADGDETAFVEIFTFYEKKIYSHILYKVSNQFLAEDFTQNTFLRFLLAVKKRSFGNVNGRAYLFTIANNLCSNYFRNNRNRQMLELLENEPSNEQIVDLDLKEMINVIFTKIPIFLDADEVKLFELKFVDELADADIGNFFGLSTSGAKAKVHRLRVKIKKFLREEIELYKTGEPLSQKTLNRKADQLKSDINQ